ncbi:MAG: GMC family oxidoreductase, partial [Candidatus Sericytochromatia bacterium]
LKEIAEESGRGHTYHSVNVGVYFGKNGEKHPDPYFNGEGPERTGCNFCGGCMVGCNYGAKNTLDKNYLYFAEKNGAEIIPERKVVDIKFEDGVYKISTVVSTSMPQSKAETYYAKGVIVSAGVLGTLKLMLTCKSKKSLPNLPDKIGESVRTNSESLTGSTSLDKDRRWDKGIAITSGFYPTDDTHVEIVRYPEKSDFMMTLATLMTDGGTKITRPLKLLSKIISNPLVFLKTRIPFGWSKRSIIFLVMQTIDNKMKVKLGKFGQLTTDLGDKSPPSYNPHANDVTYKFSEKTNGVAQSTVFESLLDLSTTAHILGGCSMGTSVEDGVIDYKCEVFNYPNLHIIDGSIIPANLGVNPSLTITAMAEQAMSHIPSKSDSFEQVFPEHKQEDSLIVSNSNTKKIAIGVGLISLLSISYYAFKKRK